MKVLFLFSYSYVITCLLLCLFNRSTHSAGPNPEEETQEPKEMLRNQALGELLQTLQRCSELSQSKIWRDIVKQFPVTGQLVVQFFLVALGQKDDPTIQKLNPFKKHIQTLFGDKSKNNILLSPRA